SQSCTCRVTPRRSPSRSDEIRAYTQPHEPLKEHTRTLGCASVLSLESRNQPRCLLRSTSDRVAKLFSMETTDSPAAGSEASVRRRELVVEMTELTAHINAATARWLALVLECRRQGVAAGDDFAVYLGWRCGIAPREAREFLRVGEALEELPITRAAFERG